MAAAIGNGAAQYVVVRLRSALYALPSSDVLEMVLLSSVAAVPQVPAYVRGVINLRGRVLPLVDLRSRLGMPSALHDLNDLIKLFEAREEDHRRWIDELDASIRQRRAFALATDPHKCAFGRWYDSLTTDDVVLAAQLRKIDQPHQRIHRRGAEALACAGRQDYERATAIAQDIRERDLAGTLRLFAETRAALRDAQREVAVVTRDGGRQIAFAVDGIEAVETLKPAESDGGGAVDVTHGAVTSIMKRVREPQLVLVLDPAKLLAA